LSYRKKDRVNISGALQDYLKTIYCLEKEAGGVSPTLLAGALGVSLPSVTSMMRKLAARGLVAHAPYRGISLTPAGERLALGVVRRHRLLESYLQQALGFGLGAVHAEADRLEHAVSEELEERIDAWLGRPSFDPHGSPIPDRAGRVKPRALAPLTSLRAGARAKVGQVTCRDRGSLDYLESIGVVPGAMVQVAAAEPGSGVVRLATGAGGDVPVGQPVASRVLVSRVAGRPSPRKVQGGTA
jgi:DtxR family transcriptional regulator, Mn-dependent transcriptional regulator